MNAGRGLFRAWVVASILWMIGAGIMSYIVAGPSVVQGSFVPAGAVKDGLKPWEIDYKKPFYEVMRSPSREKLDVEFFPVEWERRLEWDKDVNMTKVELPDRSTLYMSTKYDEQDQKYYAAKFWEQRWSRYAPLAGIIAGWALIPCMILFVLGYAMLWVVRGFKAA